MTELTSIPSIPSLIAVTSAVILCLGLAYGATSWLTLKQTSWRGRGAGLDRVVTWLPRVQLGIWAVALLFLFALLSFAPRNTVMWVLLPAVVAGVFATRDIVRNATAGAFLALEHAMRAGDNVHVTTSEGEVHGSILSIGLQRTTLEALDGAIVHLPNQTLLNSTVTKNRGHEQVNAVEIEIKVEGPQSAAELETLKRNIKRAAGISRYASAHRAPSVFITNHPDGGLAIVVRAYAFSPEYTRHLKSDVVEIVRTHETPRSSAPALISTD